MASSPGTLPTIITTRGLAGVLIPASRQRSVGHGANTGSVAIRSRIATVIVVVVVVVGPLRTPAHRTSVARAHDGVR